MRVAVLVVIAGIVLAILGLAAASPVESPPTREELYAECVDLWVGEPWTLTEADAKEKCEKEMTDVFG